MALRAPSRRRPDPRYRSEPIVTNLLEQEIEVRPVTLPEASAEHPVPDKVKGCAGFPHGARHGRRRPSPRHGGCARSLALTVAAAGESAWDYRNDVEMNSSPTRPFTRPAKPRSSWLRRLSAAGRS